MNLRSLENFLESKGITTENYDFPLLLKYSSINTSSAVNFELFLRLFARLMMYMAISNMVALLLQMRSHSTYMSLPLRIMSYQRNFYFHGVRHYHELSKDDIAIIDSIQELQKFEDSKHKEQLSKQKREELRRALIEAAGSAKEAEESSDSGSSGENESVQLLMRVPRRQLTVELLSALAQNSPRAVHAGNCPSSPCKSLSTRNPRAEGSPKFAISLLKID